MSTVAGGGVFTFRIGEFATIDFDCTVPRNFLEGGSLLQSSLLLSLERHDSQLARRFSINIWHFSSQVWLRLKEVKPAFC